MNDSWWRPCSSRPVWTKVTAGSRENSPRGCPQCCLPNPGRHRATPPSPASRRLSASSLPSAQCDGHGARSDRKWHRPAWGGQTRRDASDFDRVVRSITITDPRHPLYGRSFPMVHPISPRGKAQLVIRLPDGQPRSVPRAATDIDGPLQPALPAREVPWISVRTLHPVAQCVRSIIRAAEEVARDDIARRSGRTAAATTSVLPSPADLASPSSPAPDAARSTPGHAHPPSPHPPAPERGDTP